MQFITLLSLLLAATTVSANECCPCGSTIEDCLRALTLGRMDLRVDGPFGSTCGSLTTSLKQFDGNPTGCKSQIPENTYQRCCGSATPSANDYTWLAEIPTEAPGSNVGVAACNADPGRCGNEFCPLCWRTGEFPQKWQTVTASLFIPGNPTCRDLYYLGEAGAIPNRLCRPLQDYFEGPCGCPLTPTAGGGGGDNEQQEDGASDNADIKVTLNELLAESDAKEALKDQYSSASGARDPSKTGN